MRVRRVKKILMELDTEVATGPDEIPAIIFKKFASILAGPITKLCRRLYSIGCWPESWRMHWICAIFKRGSQSLALNYRGGRRGQHGRGYATRWEGGVSTGEGTQHGGLFKETIFCFSAEFLCVWQQAPFFQANSFKNR